MVIPANGRGEYYDILFPLVAISKTGRVVCIGNVKMEMTISFCLLLWKTWLYKNKNKIYPLRRELSFL